MNFRTLVAAVGICAMALSSAVQANTVKDKVETADRAVTGTATKAQNATARGVKRGAKGVEKGAAATTRGVNKAKKKLRLPPGEPGPIKQP